MRNLNWPLIAAILFLASTWAAIIFAAWTVLT